MSWSTSELARIAGTTVKTIRYYHGIGVLPQPRRAGNGYKQYQVEHLVTLLRILRLTDLGISPKDIGSLGGPEADPWESLRVLDSQLADQIARLEGVRAELAQLMRAPHAETPVVDLPAGMLGLADSVSDADRALLLVYSTLFDQEAMEALAQLMRERERGPAELEFDTLAPDADVATRQGLAERLAPAIARVGDTYGWVGEPGRHLEHDSQTVSATLAQAFRQLYNRAQLDVLARVNVINGIEEWPQGAPGEAVARGEGTAPP